MPKVKLELRTKTDSELLAFCTAHQTAMVGNTNYTTPSPTATIYDAALADFESKLTVFNLAQQAAKEATADKDAARVVLEALTTSRGNYVEIASGGEEPKILSAAFDVRALPSPVGVLPAPVDFMPTMGDGAGEIDTGWSPVYGARTYVLAWREQAGTGDWAQTILTKSTHTVAGLESGTTYVFRVAAVGTAGQGPWSLEAARMAP